MNKFMKAAIEEGKIGISFREGGPFGAIVVKDGKIIARGHNKVILTNDPTAHAEIVAIREASRVLGRFDLSDCELYTSCEPCPMCYGAIYWARIEKVFYGATRHDAKNIGFDDEKIYEILSNKTKDNQTLLKNIERDACLELFEIYEKDDKKELY